MNTITPHIIHTHDMNLHIQNNQCDNDSRWQIQTIPVRSMKILIYTRRNINAATEQQPTITNHMRNIQVLDKQKIAFRD